MKFHFSQFGLLCAFVPLILSVSIPDQYVVLLSEEASHEDVSEHLLFVNELVIMTPFLSTADFNINKNVGSGFHSFFSVDRMKGYVATLSDEQVDVISKSKHVISVEQDQVMYASDVELNAPWGLGRVSHREKPDESNMNHYVYNHDSGSGVVAYVVDTGINIAHNEFQGRATWGATIPEGDEDLDGNGHGSHVAGTMVGKSYGVAKNATIKAVKVLRSNGSGSMSDVIRGIEWVVTDHKKRSKAEDKNAKSIANMSLGGGSSKALDAIVNAAVTAGVHFAVAAGNDNRDACAYSPAASQKAITVGATTLEDSRAWFSNWGRCVDIFAPGHQILSSWIGSNTATNTISGTSMASPHIAGIVAALLSRPEFGDLTPAALKAKLIQDGSKGLISMGFLPPGHRTKNVFVYSHPDAKDTVSHDEPAKKDKSVKVGKHGKKEKHIKVESDEETGDYKVHHLSITVNFADDE